jgi:hypothetical protein
VRVCNNEQTALIHPLRLVAPEPACCACQTYRKQKGPKRSLIGWHSNVVLAGARRSSFTTTKLVDRIEQLRCLPWSIVKLAKAASNSGPGRDPGTLRPFLVRLDREQLLPEMPDRPSFSGLFPGRPHINLRARLCDFAFLRCQNGNQCLANRILVTFSITGTRPTWA